MRDRTFTDSTEGRMLVSNDEKLGEVVIGMPSREAAIALDASGLAELIADLSARLVWMLARPGQSGVVAAVRPTSEMTREEIRDELAPYLMDLLAREYAPHRVPDERDVRRMLARVETGLNGLINQPQRAHDLANALAAIGDRAGLRL